MCGQLEISRRASEAITKASRKVREKDIRKYFYDITELLKEDNIFEDLLDRNRVLNADEINFRHCPEKSKFFTEKGLKCL